MRWIAKFYRFFHIYFVLLKHGLDKIIWAGPSFTGKKFLLLFFPWRWFQKHDMPSGESIRLALIELGPIFVKFGQLLSTRRDLLSDDIANELAKLQDNVPPFSAKQAKETIERSLQQPIDRLFSEFELLPLASASISQVHAATLPDGALVVVKVLRPQIHQQVNRDIGLLETFSYLLNNLHIAKRFRPIEVVAEIKQTLLDELDLLREAANASQLRRNFINSDNLYVPQIYWQYSRKDVLVIERIHGIHVSDIERLKTHQIDFKRLAERGVEIFFTQVFRDSFFHADMHPGNIFVMANEPHNPKYIAVDFGIMGTLGPEDQRYLGENFLAFFKRDYRRVAELHVQSGWVPPDTPINAFETAIRTVCEPIFEKPLKEISFGQTLIRLFQTASRFNMQVQPQLLLLQKTLLSIEGLGRQLYPDLDLWQTAKPFLEKWMKKHYSPKSFIETLWNKIPLWSDKLPELPEAVYDIARFWQQETHRLHFQQNYSPSVKTPKRKATRLLGATLIICSALVLLTGPFAEIIRQHDIWIAGVGFTLGLFCLFL